MSQHAPPGERPVDPDAAHEAEHHPRGTMLLMMLFLILIVAMWAYVYLIMLQRG